MVHPQRTKAYDAHPCLYVHQCQVLPWTSHMEYLRISGKTAFDWVILHGQPMNASGINCHFFVALQIGHVYTPERKSGLL